MTPPNDAIRDAERLQEIAALDLLAPDLQPYLEELVDETARAMGLPMVIVTIVLDDAQHFAASRGLPAWMAETQGTPIEWSFCAHAVEGDAPFVVPEALSHPLVQDNPLVTLDGVRCYAGVPLRTARGFVVGTLCTLGTEDRTFSADEMDTLRRLADRVAERLEQRRR